MVRILRAPAHTEHMQGMQGIELLSALAPKMSLEGLPRSSRMAEYSSLSLGLGLWTAGRRRRWWWRWSLLVKIEGVD